MRNWAWTAGVILIALTGAGCGRSYKPIIIGSKNATENQLLAEITAQHLEHRLGRKIQRRLSLGGTAITYQEFQNGGISLYPEYTGTIETEILKEPPSTDPSMLFQRAKGEMLRTAQAVLFDPLGINNATVILVKREDPNAQNVNTLSEAAAAKDGWKIGVTIDFDERTDGFSVLNSYRLPMKTAVRSMDLPSLFRAFDQGELTMISANATDGPIEGHPDWKALEDDRHGFPAQQACILARQDALNDDPRIREALVELSGKFTNEAMRKLNAQVDVDHKPVAQVATAFLRQAGLL